jgi:hypothetical protein
MVNSTDVQTNGQAHSAKEDPKECITLDEDDDIMLIDEEPPAKRPKPTPSASKSPTPVVSEPIEQTVSFLKKSFKSI